jgi:hypothetical protein
MQGDVSILDAAGGSASGGAVGTKIRSYVMPAAELQREFDAK